MQITRYAFIQQFQDDRDAAVDCGRFNAKLLQKTQNKKVIPSTDVCRKVHIVHDCFDGHCHYEEQNHRSMEEREDVEHNTLVFVHNFANNRYLLNPFYLGNGVFDFVEPLELPIQDL